ncbi:Methyl-accepting chemotaxis sensory transducer [Tepidanaerobacter acetatoxydans Re1]|uniref:Methyl-accepting chemotaxis sensory transducer n=1 Tax=Tepidanaerobacter acetatoxydans (strain DSM 21804 / JCM 16047 / Re1) TaxID=1209989 RepID=F4LUI7_TEPAE|nr:methyl-accepting chemotaxis protein [Tepidanaerobacter acetatoxydans]AEE92632.1 methyl-accepting chemotaxis sensory transducer [Tepidanaerobacter acetatoxydans Re1]CCP27603.1 Methyl-accepting chemotaxis sensory transducer [Tepidanaerobacter acetatoxydans Re1]
MSKKSRALSGKRFEQSSSIGRFITFSISILIVIICSTLGYMSYMRAASTIQSSVSELLLAQAKAHAQSIKMWNEKIAAELESCAAKIRVRNMVWVEQKPALLEDKERLGYYNIGVADLNGNVVYIDETQDTVNNEKFFKDALGGKTSFSDPVYKNNQLIIYLATPIKNEGKQVGILVAALDHKKMNDMIAGVQFGKTGYGYMINSEGITIAHRDTQLVIDKDNTVQSAENTPELQGLAILEQKMAEGESGFGEYKYKGVAKYMAFAPVEGTDWSIALTQEKSEIFAGLNSIRRNTIIMTIVFIALGILFAFYISKTIKTPLLEVQKYAAELAEGNLTRSIDTKRRDEFGAAIRALNTAVVSFKNIVTNIQKIAQISEDTTGALNESVEQVAAGSEEVSATIQQIAEGASEQAKDAEIAVNLTAELGKKLDSISSIAKDTSDFTMQTSSKSESGLKIVTELESNFVQSSMAIEEVSQTIKAVTEKSASISNILETITSVADQTNLLALNAAIEAARAGDAGRGFAVVADEIRKLAEQTAIATKDIGGMINEITSVIRQAQTSMANAENLMGNFTLSMNNTSDIFKEIQKAVNDSIKHLALLIEQIKEIDKNKQSVISAIENISAITQESAASTEEVSAAVEEQAASMEEITASINELASMIKELSEATKVFKV